MSYSNTALKSLKKINGIRFRDGRIDTDSLETNEHRITALKRLSFIKTEDENFLRFEIGRVVNSIPDPKHGDRTRLCRDMFGEELAENMRQMAWAAERWMRKPDVGWPWSFYRYTATCSMEEQEEYIRRYREEGLKIKTVIAERAAKAKPNVTRVTFEQEEICSTYSPLSLHVEQKGVSLTAYKQQGSVHIQDGEGTLVATWPIEHLKLLQEIVAQAHCIPEPDEDE